MAVNIPVKFQTWLPLKEAAKRMNLKYSQYVRRLVKEKKLRAVLLDMGHMTKWFVDPASCDEYVSKTRRGFALGPISRRVLRFDNTVFTDEQIINALAGQLGTQTLEDGSFRWSCEKPVQRKSSPKAEKEAPKDWTAKILEMYSPGDSSDTVAPAAAAAAAADDDALA